MGLWTRSNGELLKRSDVVSEGNVERAEGLWELYQIVTQDNPVLVEIFTMDPLNQTSMSSSFLESLSEWDFNKLENAMMKLGEDIADGNGKEQKIFELHQTALEKERERRAA